MSDRINVVRCAGGLNEESSDIDISAGEVRRSSNYEQVAEGGYRRINGSVRWGGSKNRPDLLRVSVVETTTRFAIAPGEQIVFEATIVAGVSSDSRTEHVILAVIGRENSNLQIVEKRQATAFYTPGEVLDTTSPGNVIAENPELTEAEEDQIVEMLTTFGLDVAAQPAGTGEIHMLHGLNGQLICARREGINVNFQISTVTGRQGRWLNAGSLPIANIGEWDSYAYQFAGKPKSVYITTSSSKAIVYEYPATIRQITVADVTNSPKHVIVHQNHLFLSFADGVVIHSDIGDPETFSGVGGAAEFNVGSEVTGFQILPGASLAIFSEDKISILSGTSTADWQLTTYSNQVGALPNSIQNMPTTIFAAKRGITTLSASDNYGDFRDNTLSHKFDDAYQRIQRGSRLFSFVNREKSQYRLINNNGHGLYLTFANNSLVGAMEVDFKHEITAVGVIEGETDQLYFASEGWVHQLDLGASFAGRSMDAFLEFPFVHYKTPRQKKRFKQVKMDIKGDPRVELEVLSAIDKGGPFHCDPVPVDVDAIPRRSLRYKSAELSRFDQSFQGIAYTVGTGFDQSLLVRAMNSAEHEIDTITTHYTYRGQQR